MSSLHLIFSLAFALACLAGEGSATLKGDFCSDVSFWDRITYKNEERCCGDGNSKANCVTRTEEVCKEVTDMKCDATAWVECKPASGNGDDKACKAEYKDFQQKKCKKVSHNIPHLKKVPKCEQLTKDNCVTDWEVDDNGNKVWTGQETCEPVTWEECEIVEELVDFPTEKTECSTAANIKYLDFGAGSGNSDSLVHDCKVRKAVDCKPVKSTKCATVTYQDCTMEPSEEDNCGVTVPVPEQNKVHQKRCLTGDNEKMIRSKRSDYERLKDEGETCGYCYCPDSDYTAGDCKPELMCVGDPRIADIPGKCKRNCFEENTVYPGYDLNIEEAESYDRRSSAEDCQILCQETDGCNYFTWVRYRDACYLKTDGGLDTGVNNEDATSGPKDCHLV